MEYVEEDGCQRFGWANATPHAQITIYWGHPFVDFHEKKVSLQDYGMHFAVSINAF